MNACLREGNNIKQDDPPALLERISWIDYAKGLGIFLVVFGHVLRGLTASSILNESTTVEFVDHWIYSFHMPLFFAISGLLSQHSATKPFKVFLVDKAQTILYPYFIWSFVQISIISVLSNQLNSNASLIDFWRAIYQPFFIFWFLYILFLILLTYKVFCMLKIRKSYFLVFAAFLYFVPSFLPGFNLLSENWEVPGLLFSNMLYFAVGVVVNGSRIRLLEQLRNYSLIGGAIIGFSVVSFAVLLQAEDFRVLSPLVALSGITAVFSLSVLFQRLKFLVFVKEWGLFPLQIYVMHTIFTSALRIVLSKLLGVESLFVHISLGVMFGIYMPLLFNFLCKRFGINYLFTAKPGRTPIKVQV